MYCPVCLPKGPLAAAVDPHSGQPLSAFERYFCETHKQTANLRPLGNGKYECHCGWKSESQADNAEKRLTLLEAKVDALAAKLGKVK